MIEVKAVNKYYGSLQVLKDVSLDVQDGEFLCIVGPSGAGKTTLLQIMGTLEPATSGTVRYDDTEVSSLGAREKSHFRNKEIGFVFQFHQLLPEFTIQENVAMPLFIAGVGKKAALERAAKVLEEMGLKERLHHRPSQLSGGEKQRAAVARAIINQPKVLLADEPTGSLDSHNRQEIYELFSRLNTQNGITLVVVTHDESLAAAASRTVHMKDGEIVENAS